MSAQEKPSLSAEDYLAIERQAKEKSEFVDGEIFLMAGASQAHNTITTNLIGELGSQLKRSPCQTFSSNMRVSTHRKGDQRKQGDSNYVYPDVVALCDEPEFDDEHKDGLLNPALIIEVLSEGTEAYDRGRKFELYRNIPSVQEYLLIAQDRYFIEHYQRQSDDNWLLREYKDAAAVVELMTVNATLALMDVYARLVFEDVGEG